MVHTFRMSLFLTESLISKKQQFYLYFMKFLCRSNKSVFSQSMQNHLVGDGIRRADDGTKYHLVLKPLQDVNVGDSSGTP